MKNSKEMADSVFKIRDAYLEKQRKRKRKLKKAAYIDSSVCMFGLILTGIYFTFPDKQQIPTIIVPDVLENTSLSDMPESEPEDTNIFKKTTQVDTTFHEVEIQKSSEQLDKIETSRIETDVLQAIESELTQKETVPAFDSNIEENVPPPIDQEETMPTHNESNSDIEEVEEDILSTPNGFDMWTLDDIYRSFPEIRFKKQYRCLNITITEDMLELAIADITVIGSNCNTGEFISTDVVVYSFIDSAEHDEIAIWFKGRNDYIVYRAEEVE